MGRDEKDDRLLPHQIRRPRLTKSSRTSGNWEESSSDKRSKIPCRYKNCKKTRHVNFGILPVRQNCKSETGCKYGKMFLQTLWGWGEARQKVKERCDAKGSVALLKESTQLDCISGFLSEISLFYVKEENWDHNTPSSSPRPQCVTHKFEKERVHLEELSKSVNLTSVVFARQNSRKYHMRRPCTKKDAPAE